jgi:hypothetical protein
MSRSRNRHSFVHRVAVGALALVGSVFLGLLVGASETGRPDRPSN